MYSMREPNRWPGSRQSRRSLMALFLAVLGGGFVGNVSAAPRTDTAALDNLGDGLLEGLLDKLPQEDPVLENEMPRDGDWLLDPAALRDRVREAAGEDVGEEGEPPMKRVLDGMEEATRRLRQELTEDASPVQRQVVKDLEELISAMEKQCQGGQSDNQSQDNRRQASKRSQPKPSAGAQPASAQAMSAQSPARDSTTRLGSAPVVEGNRAPPEELMKAAWGHLPERLRERMLQSSSEEFLPEYREALEAYYRRLAEREAEGDR